MDTESKPGDDEKLRIAWRYGQQTSGAATKPAGGEQATGGKILQPNYFVMNQLMTAEEVNQATSISSFEVHAEASGEENNALGNALYSKLARDVAAQIDNLNLNITKTKQYTNIMRIGKAGLMSR